MIREVPGRDRCSVECLVSAWERLLTGEVLLLGRGEHWDKGHYSGEWRCSRKRRVRTTCADITRLRTITRANVSGAAFERVADPSVLSVRENTARAEEVFGY